MKRYFGALALVGSMLAGSIGMAADWGDLVLTFKLDGAAPAEKPIKATQDQAFCGQHKLVDEQLVVNSANKGISGIVVWLVADKDAKVAVHESYKATEKADVSFDNEGCRFSPRVVAMRTSQTLLLGNKDTVSHNINGGDFNFIVPAKASQKHPIKAEERLPKQVSCNVHPWMKGWVVVKETPYVGVSDKDGKVEIKNLPAGKWNFVVWQEASGYLKDINIGGKATKLSKGKLDGITIKAGANDLGEVKVPIANFKLN